MSQSASIHDLLNTWPLKPTPHKGRAMSTRNVYRQFLDLMPQRPLQVATVTATDGSTCTVQLPGGGVLQVRGAATVGAQVFVRDGVIEAVAPALTLVQIEIA